MPDNWRVREDRRKALRRDPTTRSRWVLEDSKKRDKRHGFISDLDLSFVQDLLALGCQYCGETKLKMTLDRVDNALGHTKANVVPACIRCNYMRRDMPWEAWLKFAETVRTVREQGLFGDWIGFGATL
jgi:hypothetical protein